MVSNVHVIKKFLWLVERIKELKEMAKIGQMFMRKGFVDALLVSTVVTLYFCVILPISTLLSNLDMFTYGAMDLLCDLGPRIVCCMAAVAIVLFASSFIFGRFLHVVALACVVAAIVEVGPLSIGLPELNGNLDGYRSTIRSVIDAQIIVAVIFFAAIGYRLLRPYVRIIAIAVLVYAGATLFDTKVKDTAPVPDGEMCVDALIPRQEVVQSAEYSKKGNVIVLIVDSISIDAARDSFAADDALRDRFSGFVNYIDNLGMHWYTTVAVPAIMTGRHYSHARELAVYGQAGFSKDSFIYDYITNNMPVYVNIAPSPRGYTNRRKDGQAVGVVRPINSRMDGILPWSIDQLCVFRLCPYFLKAEYVLSASKDNEGQQNDKKVNINVGKDSVLWPILANGAVNSVAARTLNVHHSRGGHPPIIYDANGNEIKCVKPGYEEYLGQCRYVFRLLGDYMDELRKKGVYDNSTIIITGDHGSIAKEGSKRDGPPQDAFPFLMVKPAKSTKSFHESNLPTSHSRIAPLVRALRENDLDEKSINDILRCENRMCRISTAGKMKEWTIKADGSVEARVYDDEEPTKDSLRPLVLNKRYDFNITTAGENYPDFVLENGSRNSSIGIHVKSNPQNEPMRLVVKTEFPGKKLSFVLNACSRRKNRIVASANGETKEFIGTEDKWKDLKIVFDDVKPDEDGFVAFAFDCSKTDQSFAIRNLVMARPVDEEDQLGRSENITIPALPKEYNWAKTAGAFLPGEAYKFNAEEVVVGVGEATAVDVVLYEATAKRFCMRKQFALENGRCEKVNWSFSVPNEQGKYWLLVYAGVAGKCQNVGVTWKNVVVNKLDGQNVNQ